MPSLFDRIPLAWLFFGTIALTALAVELGYRFGLRRKHHHPELESSVGVLVGATLGLLAFLLAFTFGLAATRFDERRMILLEEANAIGTMHLRTTLLEGERRERARVLIKEYVQVRLDAVDADGLENAIRRSPGILDSLWTISRDACLADPHSIPFGLLMESVNATIDIHSKRMQAGMRNHVPVAIWFTLYSVTLLSMLQIGYYEAVAGSRRSLAAIALWIAFSLVILLIADLDRPQDGLMRIDQTPLRELLVTI
ncbi:MAG: hypothetical protein WCI02_09355 [Planctomycetota bacterium]|jgi:hypothetical protein